MKTAPASTSDTHLRSLHARINATRRKRSVVKVATGIVLAAGILAGVFAAEMLLDWLVDLPWIARALVFLGCFGSAFYSVWIESVLPLRKRLNDDDTALLIEYGLPEFRTRFIASVQLARDTGTHMSSLVRPLLAQTAALAARVDFRNVVKTARLKRGLKMCAAIVVAASALGWLGGDATLPLLKRAMLFNVALPQKTHILSVTGDKKIGVGEDFNIKVTAGGILPSQGKVIATTAAGQKHEFTLLPDAEQPGQFSTVICSPQESFRYIVKLGDATSPSYQVLTSMRPTVADVGCEQTYPAYVDLPPVARKVNDLTLLAGSRLGVSIKASMNIEKGSLRLVGLNREIPLKVDPKDQRMLQGEIEIPPKDLTGFSVHLVSTDGVESGEGAVYRIDLVPDQAPAVKITVPERREELATSQANLRIAFEAKDDFGIDQAVLHFHIDQGEEKTIDFDLGDRAGKTVKRQFEWKMGSLQSRVTVGSVVEFWITVADRNTITGPGVGTTEHYQVKIVSADDKRIDLANRFRETMRVVSEITTNQEQLNENLGKPLFEKPKQTQ